MAAMHGVDVEKEVQTAIQEMEAYDMLRAMDERKITVTLRLEPSLVDAYKRMGPKYQTKMREVLRKAATQK